MARAKDCKKYYTSAIIQQILNLCNSVPNGSPPVSVDMDVVFREVEKVGEKEKFGE